MASDENLLIRRAVWSDVDRIVRLTNAGGPEGKPRLQIPDVLPMEYFEAFQSVDKDSKQFLMVAEIDGKIIGTFHITYLMYLAAAGREDSLIEAVHVSAEYRGRGIGTSMMNWAIGEAKRRNCRRVQLTTDKKRKDAHRFYERLGFVLSHEGAKLTLES